MDDVIISATPLSAYKASIARKLVELETVLPSLKENWSTDTLLVFYGLIHKIYNLADIASEEYAKNITTDLENHLNTLVDATVITENELTKITKMVAELKKVLANEELNVYSHVFQPVDANRLIFLFEDNIEWAKYLSTQLSLFNYQVKIFNDADIFIYFLAQHKFAAAVVNIELLNDEVEEQLLNLKKMPAERKPAIFFSATYGDVLLRLKALRLGGEAFLLKPVNTEEIITKLDLHDERKNESYRILIIDDDISSALNFSKIFEKAGMSSLINTDFTRINHVLSEYNPDLILMDLYMPNCDGMELAAIIRQQNLYESIPIIFLSAEEDKNKQLKAMQLGGDDFLVKTISAEHLILSVKSRINRYHTLRNLITTDVLTHVYNHAFMQHQLALEVKLASRLEIPLAMALVDIDNLKRINDIYGFDAGDQVLRSLSLLFRKRLRETDVIGRFSGSRFIIVFPNTTSARARQILEDMREEFSYFSHLWQGKIFYATFSVGVIAYPQFQSTLEMIDGAKKALSNAKELGRNRIEIA